jgi:large repetitive protein
MMRKFLAFLPVLAFSSSAFAVLQNTTFFDAVTTNEDVGFLVTDVVAGHFSDPDAPGAVITFTSATCSVEGFDLTGYNTVTDELTVVLPENWYSTGTPAIITITVSDNNGFRSSSTGAFGVTVNSVNDVPESTAFAMETTDEDVSFSMDVDDIMTHFSDIENDDLEISEITFDVGTVQAPIPPGPRVVNSYTFTPNENYNGDGEITITVQESATGEQHTVSETVAVLINAIDDDIVIAVPFSDETTLEDTAFVVTDVLAHFSDVEGTVNFEDATGPPGFSLVWDDQDLTITPPLNWNDDQSNGGDPAEIEISANDVTTRSSISDTFSLSVTAVNDEPTVDMIPDADTDEDVVFTMTAVDILSYFSDVDDDVLEIVSVAFDMGDTSLNTGVWSFSPDEHVFGEGLVDFIVRESATGEQYEISQSMVLNVNEVNDDPYLDPGFPFEAITSTEDVNFAIQSITDHFLDVDNDELTLSSATALPDELGLTVISNSSNLLVDPDQDVNGDFVITVLITDGRGGSTTADIDLHLDAVNDDPIYETLIGPLTEVEDIPFTIADIITYFVDVDQDALEVSAYSSNVDGTNFLLMDDDLTITPPVHYNGEIELSITVTDNVTRASTVVTVDVTVEAVNDVPVYMGSIDDFSSPEDQDFVIAGILGHFDDADFNDVIPDEIWIEDVSDNQGGSFALTIDGDDLLVTPPLDYNSDEQGVLTLSILISDGDSTADADVEVTITAVNDCPVYATAISDSSTVEDNTLLVTNDFVLSHFTDVDAFDILELSIFEPANFTVTDGPGFWEFAPDANFNGDVVFTAQVTDGTCPVEAEFTISVTAVNNTPWLASSFSDIQIDEDTPFVLTTLEILGHFDDHDLPYGDELSIDTIVMTNGSVASGIGMEGEDWVFTPDQDTNDAGTVTITVVDTQSEEATGVFAVTINPINDCLVFDGDFGNPDINEGETYSLSTADAILEFSDVENDVIEITDVLMTNGTATYNVGTGSWNMTPDAYYYGTCEISVLASDGDPACEAIGEFDLEVNFVNDAPYLSGVFNDLEIDEDEIFSVNDVLDQFSDHDPDDDLDVVGFTFDMGGFQVSMSGDDATITPAADSTGTVVVTIEVSDGTTSSDTSFDLVIVPVNDAPRENPNSLFGPVTIDEDSYYTTNNFEILSHFVDVEDQFMFVQSGYLVDGEMSTTASGDTTYYTFTPPAGYNGETEIGYVVSDLQLSGTVTQVLNVTSLEDCPVYDAVADTITITEDVVFSIPETDITDHFYDEDNDELHFIEGSDNWAAGSIEMTAGQISFDPDLNVNGFYTVSMGITDGVCGTTIYGNFVLNVVPVNDQPFVIDSPLIAETEDISFNLDSAYLLSLFDDIEGDDLVLDGDPIFADGTVSVTRTDYTFDPDPNFNGISSITVNVIESSTSEMLTVTQDLTVEIAPVNDTPVLDSPIADFESAEEAEFTIVDPVGNFSDVDAGTVLELSLITFDPQVASYVVNGNDYVVTPDDNFFGDITIGIFISDNHPTDPLGASDEFVVTITNVNDGPTVIPGSFPDPIAVTEDIPFTIADLIGGHFTDADPDDLSLESYEVQVAGEVHEGFGFDWNSMTDELEVTPAQDFHGDAILSLTITDNILRLSVTANVNLDIASVNDAPYQSAAFEGIIEVEEDVIYEVTVGWLLSHFSDVDGDEIDIAMISFSPGGATLDDDTYIHTPAADYNGPMEVYIVIRDPLGLTIDGTYVVDYTAVADAPVLAMAFDDVIVAEDGSFTIEANDIIDHFDDVDLFYGDELSILSVEMENGSVELAGSTYTFAPDADITIDCPVTIVIQDTYDLTETGEFNVTIDPLNNDAPILQTEFVAISTDEDTDFSLNENDIIDHFFDIDELNGDFLTLDTVEYDGGTELFAAGVWTFTPDQDYIVEEYIHFTVSDIDGLEADGSVLVIINPVNDAPVEDPGNMIADIVIDEDEMFEILAITSHFIDVDEDNLSVSTYQSDPPGFDFNLNGDDLTITPLENWNSDENAGTEAILTLTVTDNVTRASVDVDVNVYVNAVNDTPYLVGDLPAPVINEDASWDIGLDALVDLFEDLDTVDNPAGDDLEIDTSEIYITNGDVELQGGTTFHFSPDTNYFGECLITFRVIESATPELLFVDESFILTVAPVNDGPLIVTPFAAVDGTEDTESLIVDVLTHFNDEENGQDLLLYYEVDQPDFLVDYNGDTDILSIMPPLDFNGPAELTLTVDDVLTRASYSATVDMDFAAVNDYPVVIEGGIPDVEIDEEASYIVDVADFFTDVDMDHIDLLGATVQNGVVDVDEAFDIATFTMDLDFVGNALASVEVTDNVVANFTITTTNVNDAPVLSAHIDTVFVNEDTEYTIMDITDHFIDVDAGDILSVVDYEASIVDVDFTLDGDDLSFTPPHDFNFAQNGYFTVTVEVADIDGLSDTDEIVVQVDPINDCPELYSEIINFSMAEGTSITLNNVFDDHFLDPDGDGLDYHEIVFDCGTYTQPGAQILTLTPAENFNGICTLSIVVTDGYCTAVEEVTIEVINEADCPSYDLPFDPVTIDEDNSFSMEMDAVLAHFSDPDEDVLSLSEVGIDCGEVELNGSTLTFTPDLDFFGNCLVTFQVTDGNCDVAGTMDVTINPLNDAPRFDVAIIEALFNEDEVDGFIVEIEDKFYDAEDDEISFITAEVMPVEMQDLVVLEILSDNVTYAMATPAGDDFFGEFWIQATMTDGMDQATEIISHITVDPINDCPVYLETIDPVEVDEDENFVIVDVLSHFADVEDDELEVVSAVVNCGTATVVDGDIEFDIDGDFNGACLIEIVVSDGSCTDDAIVAVTVNAVNDAPQLATPFEDIYVDEDVDFVINNIRSHFADVENDNLIVSAFRSEPVGFDFIYDESGDDLAVSPLTDYTGLASVFITVSDRAVRETTEVEVKIELDPINDCPVLETEFEDMTAVEDEAFIVAEIFSHFSDVDGIEELEILSASFAQGSTEIGVDLVTFTPDSDFTGTSSASITVWDGNEGCSIVTGFTVDVAPVNDAPYLATEFELIEATEDVEFVVNNILAHFADPDEDALTLENVLASEEGILTSWDALSDDLTVSTPENFYGELVLTFTVSDGVVRRDNVDADAMITIIAVNDDPVLDTAFDDVVVEFNTTYVLNNIIAHFSDVDEDELSVSAASMENGSVDLSVADQVTFIPDEGFEGIAQASVTVSDTDGGSVSGLFDINVTQNHQPVLMTAFDDLEFDEDDCGLVASVLSHFEDEEGDEIYLDDNFVVDVEGFELSIVGSDNIEICPPADFNGDAILSLEVCDTFGLCTSVDIAISVAPTNDCPELTTEFEGLLIEEDEAYTFVDPVSHFSDADEDVLSVFSATVDPVETGTLEEVAGDYVFTPAFNYNGPSSVQFLITDGTCFLSSGPITITMTPVNDEPTIELPVEFTFDEDGLLIEDLSAYIGDPEQTNLTLSASGNEDVIVDITGTQVTFTATADWSGTETITFTVDDEINRLTASDDIEITVLPVNDAPFVAAALDEVVIEEDASDNSIDLNTVFDDIDGDELTFTFNESEIEHLSVTIVAGIVSITPEANWNGAETLIFTADDGISVVSVTTNKVKSNGLKTSLNDESVTPIYNRDTVDEDLLVTVNPTQDCPYFCGDVVELPVGEEDVEYTVTAEELSILIMANFCDDDNDVISFVDLIADVEGFDIVVGAGGDLSITGPQDFSGMVVLTLTVSDGICETSIDIDWEIISVNDAPVIIVCNQDELPCGEVEDLDAFTAELLTEGLILTSSDVEEDLLILSWYVNNILVSVQNVTQGECIPHMPVIGALLHGDVSLRFAISDGTNIYNEGGEECSWDLYYTALEDLTAELPADFYVDQNYPNPFNPVTNINFGLPQNADLSMNVYNISGQLVDVIHEGQMSAGHHTIQWDASQLSTGMYFVVFESQDFHNVIKVSLMK